MEDVDLPSPAVPSISRRCEKSLQGKLVLHAWNDVRCHKVDEPSYALRANAEPVAVLVLVELRSYSKFSV